VNGNFGEILECPVMIAPATAPPMWSDGQCSSAMTAALPPLFDLLQLGE
jgi:hypothetical protein